MGALKKFRDATSRERPKEVTPEYAEQIIETRRPLGKFYCIEMETPRYHRAYIGIDNTDGSAWTEEFASLGACKRWLTK